MGGRQVGETRGQVCFQGSAVDGADISRNIRAIDRAALKTDFKAAETPCRETVAEDGTDSS